VEGYCRSTSSHTLICNVCGLFYVLKFVKKFHEIFLKFVNDIFTTTKFHEILHLYLQHCSCRVGQFVEAQLRNPATDCRIFWHESGWKSLS